MRFWVVTIFPEVIESSIVSVLRRAVSSGLISIETINPRDFAVDKHRTVDDEPYGGGSGMVMKIEPIVASIEYARVKDPDTKVVLLTPRGRIFRQDIAYEYSKLPSITLVCGRYEGIDERVKFFVDDELSIGDYILSGGEYPALVVIDVVSRLVPGVLGDIDSLREESFCEWLLEYPQYTRPEVFRGLRVPEVLRSGDHKRIEEYRRFTRLKDTFIRRPDLLVKANLTDKDKYFLEKIIRGKDYDS